MTTLPHRHAAALLIVDVQNDVMLGAYERERVIGNIVSLVTRAR